MHTILTSAPAHPQRRTHKDSRAHSTHTHAGRARTETRTHTHTHTHTCFASVRVRALRIVAAVEVVVRSNALRIGGRARAEGGKARGSAAESCMCVCLWGGGGGGGVYVWVWVKCVCGGEGFWVCLGAGIFVWFSVGFCYFLQGVQIGFAPPPPPPPSPPTHPPPLPLLHQCTYQNNAHGQTSTHARTHNTPRGCPPASLPTSACSFAPTPSPPRSGCPVRCGCVPSSHGTPSSASPAPSRCRCCHGCLSLYLHRCREYREREREMFEIISMDSSANRGRGVCLVCISS